MFEKIGDYPDAARWIADGVKRRYFADPQLSSAQAELQLFKENAKEFTTVPAIQQGLALAEQEIKTQLETEQHAKSEKKGIFDFLKKKNPTTNDGKRDWASSTGDRTGRNRS